MVEHISTIVQRIMNSAHLARIEKQILDKYEEISKQPEKKEEEKPTKL